MRTLVTTTLILLLTAHSLTAQNAPATAPASPAVRGPALTGDDGKPIEGVRLAKADLKTIVHGNLAQTTMLLTFANEQPRVLGGNLIFPLPEGATVTGYGLEINGSIVDGVAVEKERARLIYEEEIHKRVDPGLVEHVEGNAFRTRLYPIPARGTRTIKIEYVTQIEQLKDGPMLTVPVAFGTVLDEFSIRIEVPEATAAPTVWKGGMAGLEFVKTNHGFIATAAGKKPAGCELVIALHEIPARSVAVEKREKFPRTIEELQQPHAIDHLPARGSFETFEHYFVITDSPAEPARKTAPLRSVRIGVVWDASLSRADADHGRELKLLESVLNRFGHPEADLIVLRNEVEVHPFLGGSAANTAKLVDTIKELPYDGATNLGGLILPKNLADYRAVDLKESPANYDFFLLFTDGFGNLGADRPARAEVPIYAICDDLRANHALLRSICQESGGSYFNLKRTTDEQVLAAVGDAPFSLVSVECNANEIADVYPPVGTEVGGRFTLAGRLLVPEAKLTLHYGYGKQVVASQTFTIDSTGAEEGTLLPRFWAQQKVAALSLFADKNAEELTRLGRQFNLVTPNTSLLVLENVDQYVQHRVVPPRSRPEIYKAFLARIEANHVQEARSREDKLREVAALWTARIQWWEQEHNYPAKLKVDPNGFASGELVARDAAAARANEASRHALDVAARAEDLARDQANIKSDTLVNKARKAQIEGHLLEAQDLYAQAVHENPSNATAQAGLDEVLTAEGRNPKTGPGLDKAQEAVQQRVEEITYRFAAASNEAREAIADKRWEAARAALQRAELAAGADRRIVSREALHRFDDQIKSTRQSLDQQMERAVLDAGLRRDAETPARIAQDRQRARLERRYDIQDLVVNVPDFTDAPDAALNINTASRMMMAGDRLTSGRDASGSGVAIAIKPWDPRTPYIAAMKAVVAEKAYGVYLAQRKVYGKSPAFYLDCADYLISIGQREMGIRVLTDIIELELHDARLLRVAAHRLNQIGERELAIDLFEKVLKLRLEEPQSYRDLALALADRAEFYSKAAAEPWRAWHDDAIARALSDYTRALELLNKVVLGDWPRFPEIELPVLMEANNIAAKAQRLAGVHDFHNPLDPRLQKNLELDLRVVMTWDADQTDVDLWVTEPSGEKCLYSHNRTIIGGLLSRDFTDGYGPEEYCLRKLMPGQYTIQANFYGSHQQELTGPATVQATVITNFGRPSEKRQAMTLRLKEVQQVVDIGAVMLGASVDTNAIPANRSK